MWVYDGLWPVKFLRSSDSRSIDANPQGSWGHFRFSYPPCHPMSVSPGTVYGIPCASGHPGRRAKVMAEDVLIDLLVLNVGNGEMMGNGMTVALWQINIDPENHQLQVETNLPTPIWQGLCYIIYWRVIVTMDHSPIPY